MNAPNRYELFVLGYGEDKLTFSEDPKTPNTGILVLNKENHTLANMLRGQLLQTEHVVFAGYKVPHPLDPKVVIRIQTTPESTPLQAARAAIHGLILNLTKLKRSYNSEVLKAKARAEMDGEGFGAEPADDGAFAF